jgi:16S rRNA (guanine966-N2)-methyltransferase
VEKISRQKQRASTASKPSKLRVIGGRWRGRSVEFFDHPGLRPTGDRVRETVFNWLQGDIAEACCLDLFAGSGAMGFEAASRGARQVSMVELSTAVAKQLSVMVREFQAQGAVCVYNQSALDFVSNNNDLYDLVFIDPPFDSTLHRAIVQALSKASFLNKGCKLYIETPKAFALAELIPAHWVLLKEKSAGQVDYRLYEVVA